ncbi:MAG: SDR family oxidoreductase [Treponema sp.]|jgi:all-trans-retinol dehydrogenase (NAD+)|nr:SDR family oxidoreductase [Treponema sp.]
MKDITNKLILITGGASGIGRLMAFDFARRGGRVAIWDLDAAALKALETEAAAEGLFIVGMVCDVSDRAAVARQAKALLQKLGPVDILINNAGIVSGKKLLEIQEEKIIQTINVNVLSLFWTTRAFLPSMIERNSGHIVTIASAAGLIGVKGLSDYCAGKFAAVGFDESLRMELRHTKSAISTTVICPYFIDTGMFKGVKTRFPLLLPILSGESAARRIVKAVLKNKKRLIMPRFVYSTLLVRLLPPGGIDALADFFGISSAMNDFTGREPSSASPAKKAGTVSRKKQGAVQQKTQPQKTPSTRAAKKPAAKAPVPKKTTAKKTAVKKTKAAAQKTPKAAVKKGKAAAKPGGGRRSGAKG